jgi:hypothetical protein
MPVNVSGSTIHGGLGRHFGAMGEKAAFHFLGVIFTLNLTRSGVLHGT